MQIVHPGPAGLVKMAAADTFCDEVHGFVERLQPKTGHTYVLNNALGAEEYYGSNVNGDSFPIEGLLYGHETISRVPAWDVDGRRRAASAFTYGYGTFYTAHIFQHHVNKDPSKTLGRIVLVAWNPKMYRVEVVFELDHQRCRNMDAYSLIERINENDFPSTSMGCRVPYDICSICGNRAKTRADYCIHVNNKDRRFGMNKILPDGRRCFVRNTIPRFFDDSFVVIGADKTAYVMAKLAHDDRKYWIFTKEGAVAPSALRGEVYYSEVSMEKAASAPVPTFTSISHDTVPLRKQANGRVHQLRVKRAALKLSEMLKKLPAGPSIVKRLENQEPDLPLSSLKRLGNAPSLQHALSAPTSCGMVLKPHEYQRVALMQGGLGHLADEYDRAGTTFQPRSISTSGHKIPVEAVAALIQMLLPLMSQRSVAPPVMERRVVMMFQPGAKPAAPSRAAASDPVLEKLAEGYAEYRGSLVVESEKIAELLHPEAISAAFREDVLDAQAGIKQASPTDAETALKLLALVGPVLYLNSAHLKAKLESGEDLGLLQRLLAKHPVLMSTLAVGGGASLLRKLPR